MSRKTIQRFHRLFQSLSFVFILQLIVFVILFYDFYDVLSDQLEYSTWISAISLIGLNNTVESEKIENNIKNNFYNRSDYFKYINSQLRDINKNFISTEWYQRWTECDKLWLNQLNQLPNPRSSYKTCMVNIEKNRGGIGNKFFRQSVGFFVSSLNYCQLSIDWGWLDSKCINPMNFFPQYQSINHNFNKKYQILIDTLRKDNENENISGSGSGSEKITDKDIAKYDFSDEDYYINLFGYLWKNNFEFKASERPKSQIDKYSQRIPKIERYQDLTGLSFYLMIDNYTNETKFEYPRFYNKWGYYFYIANDTREKMIINDENIDKEKIYENFMNVPLIDNVFEKNNFNLEWFYMRTFNQHMEYRNVQRFHGLLVKYLQPMWRIKSIKFIEKEFSGDSERKFVIGTHLRYGNGEQFDKFHREMSNIHEIVDQFIIILKKFLEKSENRWISISNIKIFIASDTFASIQLFRKLVINCIPDFKYNQIVSLPQTRLTKGFGHLFSLASRTDKSFSDETIKKKDKEKVDCIANMADVYLDSEILGFSDLLILPIASTYTRLARLLMIKRRKQVCIAQRDIKFTNKSFWKCANFANIDSNEMEKKEKENKNVGISFNDTIWRYEINLKRQLSKCAAINTAIIIDEKGLIASSTAMTKQEYGAFGRNNYDNQVYPFSKTWLFDFVKSVGNMTGITLTENIPHFKINSMQIVIKSFKYDNYQLPIMNPTIFDLNSINNYKSKHILPIFTSDKNIEIISKARYLVIGRWYHVQCKASGYNYFNKESNPISESLYSKLNKQNNFIGGILFDNKFNILSHMLFDFSWYSNNGNSSLAGLNDCRLFKHLNKIYVDCITFSNEYHRAWNYFGPLLWFEREEDKSIGLHLSSLTTKRLIYQAEYLNKKNYHKPKNLIPLSYKNELYFQWLIEPTYFIKIDSGIDVSDDRSIISAKFAFSKEYKYNQEMKATRDKPSKHQNVGYIYLNEFDEYLGVGHYHYDLYKRLNLNVEYGFSFGTHYTHFFYTINSQTPFSISKISNDFCFVTPFDTTSLFDNDDDKTNIYFDKSHSQSQCDVIQFVVGMIETRINDIDYFLLSYGVNDCMSSFALIKRSTVLSILEPLQR